jgi:predicted transcriptional regulator
MLVEILRALMDGPMIRDRLSRTCNLNYQRLVQMLERLEHHGLVSHRTEEGHEVYSLTPSGLESVKEFMWYNAVVHGGRVKSAEEPPTVGDERADRRDSIKKPKVTGFLLRLLLTLPYRGVRNRL